MEYLIGVALAVGVGLFTTFLGMDRDRALYPAILMVIAALYDLFAVMGGSNQALVMELGVGVIFVGLAVVGFKSTLWFTVVGLAGHGVYDFVHTQIFQNPGVPTFWPMFCSAYDVAAAFYLAWLISRNRIRSITT